MKISWWQWWPFRRWRCVGFVESADEIPDKLPRNGAVIVGNAGGQKWVGFDCPCRNGHRILLNSDPARKPTWKVTVSPKGRLSIAPSVDYHDDRRRCHYFVRDGKIAWAKDTVR